VFPGAGTQGQEGGDMSVLGRSLSFPPRIGADGRFAWSEGETNIRESIAVILKTEAGERLMLPSFGAGLGRFLFEPNETSTHTRIADAITTALARWEPRIQVEDVSVAADPQDAQAAVATIAYRLVATGSRERISLNVPTAS
jgi:phage baseplate assembly protein W